MSGSLRAFKQNKKKLCQIKCLLWQRVLCLFFLCESIWYVGFCSAEYFGSSCFVTTWVFKTLFLLLLLHKETGRKQAPPHQDKWLMTRGVLTFLSCDPFRDDRMSLRCFQVTLLGECNRNLD